MQCQNTTNRRLLYLTWLNLGPGRTSLRSINGSPQFVSRVVGTKVAIMVMGAGGVVLDRVGLGFLVGGWGYFRGFLVTRVGLTAVLVSSAPTSSLIVNKSPGSAARPRRQALL